MNAATAGGETFGLPIDQATAFSDNKGRFRERIKKQQLKMLREYVPLLKQFLEPGEEVLFVLRGCSPITALEHFTTGWIIYYLKRCTLVVTNLRILHFPAAKNFSPRQSIAEIRYGDVAELKPSAFMGRRLTVKYKNGTKETFLYMKESAKLKSVLARLLLPGQQPTPFGNRHHLCPKCNVALTSGVYRCSSCRLEFKSEERARKVSILYPGGGYFYTGHPFLGAGDAVVEILLTLLVILGVVHMLSGGATRADGVGQFVAFGFLLALEKLYSVYHAKQYVKEFIPVEKNVRPRKAG